MSTGDLANPIVQDNGMLIDLEVAGWSGYTSIAFNPSLPPTLTVVSEGYSGSTATTVTRTVKAFKVQTAAAASGSNAKITLYLDNPVHDDDRALGTGVSGTQPTITVSSGWLTGVSGGTTNPAKGASAVSVTNNSTLDYPKVMARFATASYQRHFGGTWYEQVLAYALHANSTYPCGITLIECRIKDADNVTKSVTATAPTVVSAGTANKGPSSAYHLWQFQFTTADRGDSAHNPFAHGAASRHFTAYPRIGDANSVFNTESSADAAVLGAGMTHLDAIPKRCFAVSRGGTTTGRTAAR